MSRVSNIFFCSCGLCQVQEFALAVQEEDETAVYGGAVKAPKVLADIVESVVAAVYVDCEFDLKYLWQVTSH